MTEPQLVLQVPDMTCDHCVHAVTTEIAKVDGVTDVRVDLDTKRVEVDGTTDTGAVDAAVDEAGYEAKW